MSYKNPLLYGIGLALILALISCHSKHNEQTQFAEFTQQSRGANELIDMSQFTNVVLDIPYANNQNPRQTLDIVYPSVGEPPYKTIVVLHGGGWMTGDKQSKSISTIFQATTQGYALVSVNYRLSDEVKWPKPLLDAKAALRHIRVNASIYKLDAEKIVVWGESAGAHIAMMLAATNGHPAFENLSMGNTAISSSVQGVVAWYGIADMSRLPNLAVPAANEIMGYDISKNWEKTNDANPIKLVTDQFPPILLVHGTSDQIIPFSHSANMHSKVNNETDKPTAELIAFEGAGHGDAVIKSMDNVIQNLDFVDKILFNGNNPYRNKNYIKIRLAQ
ncbi:MAG: alpha/beta hydrolase [Tenuifilaceae bacterium]|jgi:acetyl esterase/lipase|nr:alpha/beta hydrolase [Tenuifilaceae bacterium]